MAVTYQRNEDVVVRNASGLDARGRQEPKFRLIDRSAPYDSTWHTSYEDAVDKGRTLAQSRKVTLWYEPDPLRPGMTLVETFRSA
jgi:hypothetical protein